MNNMSFMKGVGLGIMVGSVAGMIAAPRKKPVRLGKALKSVGGIVENMTSGLGL
ncbi:MAG: hypothetical protein IKD79_05095 [Oscillospiraceae bacterium]|nr:hypothetical protein [Oscillospiraceae bacterium]